jgi:hypothetical protein
MISTRFAPIVCVILGLALVPTIIHSYVGAVSTDGLSANVVPGVLAGFPSTPTDRDAGWGGRRFDSPDWMERRYSAGGSEVVVTVLRSYDHKRLYHHPELDIAYGTTYLSETRHQFDARPDAVVRVLSSGGERAAMAAYVLHYDGSFVDDPVVFQIRAAGEMLFRPRRPMTLLFARESSVPRGAVLQDTGLVRVLLAAVDAFTGRKS